MMESILTLLRTALPATGEQLLLLSGTLFLLGTAMYITSRSTRKLFINAGYPKLDVYLTGWIGTPVHELGHAVFCVLFRHQIVEIRLFTPNSEDGTLGYVHHRYNSRSFYQSAGRFFIGAGPLFFGSAVLFLLTAMLPGSNALSNLFDARFSGGIGVAKITAIAEYGKNIALMLFTGANVRSWQLYVFLYLSLCIASHMQLSPSDLKGMFFGFFVISVLLFLLNVTAAVMGVELLSLLPFARRLSELAAGLLCYGFTLSLINFIFIYALLFPVHYLRYRKILIPV